MFHPQNLKYFDMFLIICLSLHSKKFLFAIFTENKVLKIAKK